MPRSTTTISPTPFNPIKLPPHNTTTKSFPGGRWGSKGSFRIDTKVFSLSFDGGQADSYAIHESRQNIKRSIWVGRKGLEWILSCFANIRDWVPGKDYLCKCYRENNKFFKFQGRSNKAGLFVHIVVYYGGARCSCVMIPASSNHSGWCMFTKELDRFLSGENTVLVEGMTSNGVVGGGSTTSGGKMGRK